MQLNILISETLIPAGLFLFSIYIFSSSLPEVAHSHSEVFENIPECKEGEADEEAESSPKVGD